MPQSFEQVRSSIARIHSTRGIVGVGVVVTNRRLVTCAHVVARALGIPADSAKIPAGPIHMIFPFAAEHNTRQATVLVWHPERAGALPGVPGVEVEDLTILELQDALPAGASPVSLSEVSDVWGHPIRAFGYPGNLEFGVWADGILQGREGHDWIQLKGEGTTGYRIEAGFSGTPVWDAQLSEVVGIIVATDNGSGRRTGFVVPTKQIQRAWPELLVFARSLGQDNHLKLKLDAASAAWTSARAMGLEWEEFKELMRYVQESGLRGEETSFMAAGAAYYAWGMDFMLPKARDDRKAIEELAYLVANCPWPQPAWRAAYMLQESNATLVSDALSKIRPEQLKDETRIESASRRRFNLLSEEIRARTIPDYLVRLRDDSSMDENIRRLAAEALEHLTTR